MASQDAPLTLTTSQDLPPDVVAAYNRMGIQVRRRQRERVWWLCPACLHVWEGDAAPWFPHWNPDESVVPGCDCQPVRVREVIDGG